MVVIIDISYENSSSGKLCPISSRKGATPRRLQLGLFRLSLTYGVIAAVLGIALVAAVGQGLAGVVYGVAFCPTGRHVVSASADGTARLWDVTAGRAVRSFRGHGQGVVTGCTCGRCRSEFLGTGGSPPVGEQGLSPQGRSAGQKITATARVGSVEVSSIFIAVDSGAAGDVIRILNPDTKRTLRARVVSTGLVEVINVQ